MWNMNWYMHYYNVLLCLLSIMFLFGLLSICFLQCFAAIFLLCRLIILFEYLVEVKRSGEIKVLVNEAGQYKGAVGFDCSLVWKLF